MSISPRDGDSLFHFRCQGREDTHLNWQRSNNWNGHKSFLCWCSHISLIDSPILYDAFQSHLGVDQKHAGYCSQATLHQFLDKQIKYLWKVVGKLWLYQQNLDCKSLCSVWRGLALCTWLRQFSGSTPECSVNISSSCSLLTTLVRLSYPEVIWMISQAHGRS